MGQRFAQTWTGSRDNDNLQTKNDADESIENEFRRWPAPTHLSLQAIPISAISQLSHDTAHNVRNGQWHTNGSQYPPQCTPIGFNYFCARCCLHFRMLLKLNRFVKKCNLLNCNCWTLTFWFSFYVVMTAISWHFVIGFLTRHRSCLFSFCFKLAILRVHVSLREQQPKETIEYHSAVLCLWLLYVRMYRLGWQGNWIKKSLSPYLCWLDESPIAANLILSYHMRYCLQSHGLQSPFIPYLFIVVDMVSRRLSTKVLYFRLAFTFRCVDCNPPVFTGTVRGAHKAKCWSLCDTRPECIASANRTHAVFQTTVRSARVYFIERFVWLWVWIMNM